MENSTVASLPFLSSHTPSQFYKGYEMEELFSKGLAFYGNVNDQTLLYFGSDQKSAFIRTLHLFTKAKFMERTELMVSEK